MIRVIHSVIIIKILVCYQFEPFSHSKRFRIHFAKSIPIQKLLTLKIWIHAYMWHIEYSLMRPCMYTSNLFHSVELGFKIVTLNSNVSKFKCIITKPFRTHRYIPVQTAKWIRQLKYAGSCTENSDILVCFRVYMVEIWPGIYGYNWTKD